MNVTTAHRLASRAAIACAALLLSTATAAPAAIVINEAESDGAPDFVELFNTGSVIVDIGGYVIKDSDDGNSFTVPGGTSLAAGSYYLADTLGFGLGSPDAARLFAPGDLVNPIDSYAWTSHAGATYGRCPNGTGAFAQTSSPTPGAANDCPLPASPWPGATAISIADGTGVFGGNLSGLAYQPSGTSAPGVLWAVRNNTPGVFRLVWDGTKWTPDTATGWGAGKQLFYGDGAGVPDAEGVTLAGGDPSGVYVATERNDTGGGASRPAVLRYDVSSAGATLSATTDWNLTPDLPGLGGNAGLEAITWIPDDVLVAKGFRDEATAAPYDPADHPGHGNGLFFVGVEQDGRIVAYALKQSDSSYTRVASIASGFPKVMALEYEAESRLLWAVCDNDCGGRHATLDVAQTGGDAGRYVVKSVYDRPAGMADLNNEGFAIAPQAECVDSRKPVVWADDGNTDAHALRTGGLSCTALPVTTPPPVTPPPGDQPPPPPGPPPPAGVSQPPQDLRAPVLSRVRASRKRVAFGLSERARVRITIERRSGRRYRRLKAFTVTLPAGTRTVRFKGRVPASRLRRGRLRITLVATDVAGNRSAPTRRQVR